jgi:hypothetical protein
VATLKAEPFNQAEVTKAINLVSLLPQGTRAAPGDVVKGNNALQTGGNSRAELQFPDLTITRVGSNALFRFIAGTREIVPGIKSTRQMRSASQLDRTQRHWSIFSAVNDSPHPKALVSGRFLKGHRASVQSLDPATSSDVSWLRCEGTRQLSKRTLPAGSIVMQRCTAHLSVLKIHTSLNQSARELPDLFHKGKENSVMARKRLAERSSGAMMKNTPLLTASAA